MPAAYTWIRGEEGEEGERRALEVPVATEAVMVQKEKAMAVVEAVTAAAIVVMSVSVMVVGALVAAVA